MNKATRRKAEQLKDVWRYDFDGGRNLHADADEAEAIAQFFKRNGYRAVYVDGGRVEFWEV